MQEKSIKIFVQDIFDKHALEKSHFNNIDLLQEEGTIYDNVKLFKTNCRHGIRETAEPIFLANGMRWESMGVVFKSEQEPTLYIAGDTIWYEGIKQTLDTYTPEYVIVNAACTQKADSTPLTMGIDDIKALHEYYPMAKIIASHLDCAGHSTLCRKDIIESDIKDYVYLPADGELMIYEK